MRPNKNILNGMVLEVDNVVLDGATGRCGIRNNNGSILTLVKEGDEFQVAESLVDVSVQLPAFATRKLLDAINIGDIFVSQNSAHGWVIEKQANSCVVLTTEGAQTKFSSRNIPMMGVAGFMVVEQMFLQPDQNQPSISNTMLPFLMMSNKKGASKLLQLLMISQNKSINPIIIAMLLNKKEED